MSFLSEVQAAAPQIRVRMRKADSFDEIVPAMLLCSLQLAGGDAAKGRQVASAAAPIAETADIKPWNPGMHTEPGDFVTAPQGGQVYIYTGKDAMTHANQGFYPGAAGVYYWSPVPKMHEGNRIFPDIPGIVVYVKNNELWWDPSIERLYRWTGGDYDCPSNFYPGAAGVHQWTDRIF